MSTWIFQCNPKKFHIDDALMDPEVQTGGTWLAEQEGSRMASGQEAYIYKTSPTKAIIAKVTILSEFKEMPPLEHMYRHWSNESKKDDSLKKARSRVYFRVEELAPNLVGIPLSKLRDLRIPAGRQGMTNIRLKNSNEVNSIQEAWASIGAISISES
ncbi:MAG: EVE domain-containing protein [Candidatus Thalassarchaeaceae archaeon]|nr:EVE domain-containing protein [Candidatus Thalassarchaeaceae archaeon]